MVATLVQLAAFVGLIVGAALVWGAGGLIMGLSLVGLLVGAAMDER